MPQVKSEFDPDRISLVQRTHEHSLRSPAALTGLERKRSIELVLSNPCSQKIKDQPTRSLINE
jgi:hypothetical protein